MTESCIRLLLHDFTLVSMGRCGTPCNRLRCVTPSRNLTARAFRAAVRMVRIHLPPAESRTNSVRGSRRPRQTDRAVSARCLLIGTLGPPRHDDMGKQPCSGATAGDRVVWRRGRDHLILYDNTKLAVARILGSTDEPTLTRGRRGLGRRLGSALVYSREVGL